MFKSVYTIQVPV